MKDIAIIRSMSTKEGDHGRATFNMRTGYQQTGPIRYPTLGSLVAKELGRDDAELPNFVSIAPFRSFNPGAFGPGFLGPQYAPLVVGERAAVDPARGRRRSQRCRSRCEDLNLPSGVDNRQADARLGLLDSMRQDFLSSHPGVGPVSHQDAYLRAVRLMHSAAAKAFDLEDEPAAVRDAYGRTAFGQGCLLARRLVERGVPFVEVSLSSAEGAMAVGWDTHQQNFESVKKLSEVLDPAWATLMDDLRTRGLLDSTLIVWMGEFGRTPKINATGGPRPLPRRLDDGPGRWRDQGRAGHRQYGRRRHGGQRPPGHGPRLAGHGLQGALDRPDGAKRLRRRAADPARRPQGQADPRRCSHDLALELRRPGSWRPCSGLLSHRLMRTMCSPRCTRATGAGRDAVQDVMFLTDTRPIFIRLRLDAGDKSFRTAWFDAVKAIHAYLDRDGNGTLTKDEADRGSLPDLVRAATGGAAALPRADLDTNPKDGVVSHRRAGGCLAAGAGPVPRAGRPARGRAERRPLQPSRSRQGRHGHEGRAGRGRSVAPPL